MENRDLKDVFKTVKEKKRKEKIERLLIYMSGILLTLVFIAIGLNFFSGTDKNQVSEPDIKIVKDINQPSAPPQIPKEETLQEVKIPQQENQPQAVNQPDSQKEDQKPIQTTQPTQNLNKPQQVQTSDKEQTPTNHIQNDTSSVESQPKKEETIKQKPESKPTTVKEEKTQIKKEEIHRDKNVAKVTESTEMTKKTEHTKEKTQKQTESKNEVLSLITSGYFSIQTGAFSTKEKALVEKSKYKDAFVIEENGLYKVLVGKFKSDKEAREYRAQNNIPGFIKRISN